MIIISITDWALALCRLQELKLFIFFVEHHWRLLTYRLDTAPFTFRFYAFLPNYDLAICFDRKNYNLIIITDYWCVSVHCNHTTWNLSGITENVCTDLQFLTLGKVLVRLWSISIPDWKYSLVIAVELKAKYRILSLPDILQEYYHDRSDIFTPNFRT
jgi:hypothetical protein